MASYESYPDPEEKPQEDAKKGLKVVLVIAVIVLIVVAVAVGVTVWRNNALPAGHQADTEALTQNTAGVNNTTFSEVELSGVPSYSGMYGKTLKQLKSLPNSKLRFGTGLKKAGTLPDALGSSAAKKVRYEASASLKGTEGVGFKIFFSKEKKSIAMCYTFDLDALGVSEADFALLATDRKIASSLLLGVGLDKDVASQKELSRQENAPTINNEGNTRECVYKGKTGDSYKKVVKKKKVYDKKKHKKVTKKTVRRVQTKYMSWQLEETYVYAEAGGTAKRTATITLH